MPARGLLIALLFIAVSPQTPQRFPIHIESLTYPPLARTARITGNVVLLAHISNDGSVSIPIRKSGHPLLMDAAEANLKKWKFSSGDNQEMEITYHFKVIERVSYSDQTDCTFDLPHSVTVAIQSAPVNPIESQADKPTKK